jgi:hypothetical protein
MGVLATLIYAAGAWAGQGGEIGETQMCVDDPDIRQVLVVDRRTILVEVRKCRYDRIDPYAGRAGLFSVRLTESRIRRASSA